MQVLARCDMLVLTVFCVCTEERGVCLENKRQERRTYSDEEIVLAIRGSGGIRTHIAEKLGCTMATLRSRLRESPELRAELELERQAALDLAEGVILDAIRAGDVKVAQWFLTRQGVDRGYGDKKALTGPGGGPLSVDHRHTVQVMIPDNGRLRVGMLSTEERKKWEESVVQESQRLIEERHSSLDFGQGSEAPAISSEEDAETVVDGEFELVQSDIPTSNRENLQARVLDGGYSDDDGGLSGKPVLGGPREGEVGDSRGIPRPRAHDVGFTDNAMNEIMGNILEELDG